MAPELRFGLDDPGLSGLPHPTRWYSLSQIQGLKPCATQVEDGLEGLSAAGNGETGYRVAVKPQGHPAKPVTVPIHVASDSSTLPMKVSA